MFVFLLQHEALFVDTGGRAVEGSQATSRSFSLGEKLKYWILIPTIKIIYITPGQSIQKLLKWLKHKICKQNF
jgi:hypothetical protein